MTTFLIIVGIIGVLIAIFLISNSNAVKKHKKEYQEVCDAHKKLGYPELDRDTQFKIMMTGDLSPIGALIPEFKSKIIPMELLRHYIKISKEEFKDFLGQTEFLEHQKITNAPNPNHDGIWIKDNQIIDQERGQIHRTWNIQSDKDAINVYGDLLWEKLI